MREKEKKEENRKKEEKKNGGGYRHERGCPCHKAIVWALNKLPACPTWPTSREPQAHTLHLLLQVQASPPFLPFLPCPVTAHLGDFWVWDPEKQLRRVLLS